MKTSLLSQSLLMQLQSAVQRDPFWNRYLGKLPSAVGLHLAIVTEPYLRLILNGRKSAESRFSKYRIAPYNTAKTGDVILLKRPAGTISGICLITGIKFYKLDPDSWYEIKTEYADSLCIDDPGFWERKKRASFATVMELGNVLSTPPVIIEKRDRRGWVVLKLHS